MLLVDTNIVIDYLRQRPQVVAFVDHYGKDTLALSPIVVMEVFQGVLDKVDFQRTRKALTGFTLLDFDASIAQVSHAIATAVRIIAPNKYSRCAHCRYGLGVWP